MDTAQTKRAALGSAILTLSDEEKRLQAHVQVLHGKIKGHFSAIIASLQAKEKEMLTAVDTQATMLLNTLQSQSSSLQSVNNALEKSCAEANGAMQAGSSDADTLSTLPGVSTRLRDLASQKHDTEPRANHALLTYAPGKKDVAEMAGAVRVFKTVAEVNLPRWDRSHCPPSLQLGPEDRTVTALTASGGSLIAATSCNTYRVRVSSQTALVGFSTLDGFVQNAQSLNNNTSGWFLYTNNGFIRAPNRRDMERYGRNPVPKGSIVECTYNAADRSISFSVNGQNWGPAFRGQAIGEMYPAATSLSAGDTLELVS